MALTLLTAEIIDNGLVAKDSHQTVILAIKMFAIAVVMSAVYLLVKRLQTNTHNNVMLSLRHTALQKLLCIKIDYYDQQSATELFSQIDEDVTAIAGCFSNEILMSLLQVLTVAGLIPVLCGLSWKLTICMLLFIPFKVIKTLLLSKRNYRNIERMIHVKKDYGKWLAEVVSGMPMIRLFGVQEHFDNAFFRKQKTVLQTQYRREMLEEFDVQTENTFISFLDALCYCLACYLIIGNEITLGEFIAFQGYSVQILGFVSQCMGLAFEFSAIMPSLERNDAFFHEEEEACNGCSPLPTQYDIEFSNVSFTYTNGQQVLHGFSARIPQGSHIALVGPNGCGKSTVMALLVRLYEPSHGTITVGDTNIHNFDLQEYRSLLSVALQRPFLFCDSIYNNITMYRDVSDKRLEEIIDAVNLRELIQEKGWDYCVGQDGCELSGGQRQLIALGRLLIHDAPIIIMDETEANVDEKYESLLQGLLNGPFAQKTVFMITHRKELLAYMDNVISIVPDVVACDN